MWQRGNSVRGYLKCKRQGVTLVSSLDFSSLPSYGVLIDLDVVV